MSIEPIDIPLMHNNITESDLDCVIKFLQSNPILTQNKNVKEFEKEWSKWLGVKHSVFVNSGSSANLITMAALRYLYGQGEVIVPALTWVSDIASVVQAGHTPVLVDINPKNLAMNEKEVLEKISDKTKAVFLTHILGFNGLSQSFLRELTEKNILLIEDVCESHGAVFEKRRLGSYGFASNFSFYYAHHMTTVEGGMVCTDNEDFYETLRMLRSHGMVREASSEKIKEHYKEKYPDLNPDFIFAYPAYNVRSTEINAVMGLNQLKKLDNNNLKRQKNCDLFYKGLDSQKYRTDFDFEGSVNYAFVLILKNKDDSLSHKLQNELRKHRVEFRRGTSGGGNQARQPYFRNLFGDELHKNYLETDHIHFYGFYIGNFPELEAYKIERLTSLLNQL